MSALGRERGRAEKGEGGRERVRERSEGAAWRHPKRPGRSGKQEVAGAASALATEQLRGEGEEDDWQLGCTVTGRAEAGPATGKWPRYGSFSLSFSNYLSFLLFCKFRALLKILKQIQKS